MNASRTWTLLNARGRPYASPTPGRYGGHRRSRIYGHLDCRAARQAIERGGYVTHGETYVDDMLLRLTKVEA